MPLDPISNLESSISTLHSPISNQYRSKARVLIERVARVDDVDERVGRRRYDEERETRPAEERTPPFRCGRTKSRWEAIVARDVRVLEFDAWCGQPVKSAKPVP